MIKKTIFLLILIFIFFSCKIDKETESQYFEKSKIDKIDSLAKRYFDLKRFSGTILVIKQDTLIYNQSFGYSNYEELKPFTDKTAFKIGEISELITKNSVQNLIANGKIQLSDSISKHLPQLKSHFKIEDLINHSTNFPSIETIAKENPELDYNTITFANLIKDSISLEKKSNLNYNILGHILKDVTGKSFQKNIEIYSSTLGLENTFYTKIKPEIAVGYVYHNYRNKGLELQQASEHNLDIAFSSRGLKTTAKDLAKIIYQNPDKAINIEGYTANDGFSYSLQHLPKNKMTIIVLSNFRHPIAKEISNSINSILNDKSYQLPLARQSFNIDRKLLKDFTGNYSLNEFVNFRVTTRNDSLFTILGLNEVYLVPQSANQFYMQDRDAAMRFLRDSNNTINTVELLDGFIDGQIARRK